MQKPNHQANEGKIENLNYPSTATRRAEKRFEAARQRSILYDDFPKLVEHRGGKSRIKNDPPLIFHRTAEMQTEYDARIAEALAYQAGAALGARTLSW